MTWTGNTPEQVANGRRLLAHYGSWDRIRAASRYDHKRGGFVIADDGRRATPEDKS